MPSKTSPYKRYFKEDYPEHELAAGKRNAISSLRSKWKVFKPPNCFGDDIKVPDKRTMRTWRNELFGDDRQRLSWVDPTWSGEITGDPPLGWMHGLNLIAQIAQDKKLTERQARHAQLIYSSVTELDLAGVWVLVNEYTIFDRIRHEFGDAAADRTTTRNGLAMLLAFKPWLPENQSAYLGFTDPFIYKDGQDEVIQLRTVGYLKPTGPPFFLATRYERSLDLDFEFMAKLIVHFSHLIGNPFSTNRPIAGYTSREWGIVSQFSCDPFSGMSWQEIVAAELDQ